MSSRAYSELYSNYIDDSIERLGLDGQEIYRFPNGYGASVLPEPHILGVEIAVIRFAGERFHLVNDTHITNDVLRGQADLDYRLKQIKELD